MLPNKSGELHIKVSGLQAINCFIKARKSLAGKKWGGGAEDAQPSTDAVPVDTRFYL